MRPIDRAALAAAAGLALCVCLAAAIGSAAASPAASVSDSTARPPIHRWPIPFGAKRKREMAAYSERHYGENQWRLVHPQVIVEHVAETSSAASVYNTFAPDVPDVELHELPNVCSHFVIGASGKIFQLVNLRTRCRHTVGLNWTAIGIEHVGFADSDVLDNRGQMHASLRLTQYLRCHFGIPVHDVIGHAESLSSPFHHELVSSLKTQTHGDWRHSSMRIYRRRLRRLGPC
ncbi:MAG: N-acetylmuramoyl-L-alanine amidase [Solirubrobacterales bacterium]|nr:N-acetylmuramoyl-L-alanine amidase [Solirubrobacterales bacterium]